MTQETRQKRVERILREALAPVRLEVIDESHQHRGHSGNPGGVDGTHLRVVIVSPQFEGLSRVARQRRVYALLERELQNGLHALALQTLSSSEIATK
jgi:stress-induced morphogen